MPTYIVVMLLNISLLVYFWKKSLVCLCNDNGPEYRSFTMNLNEQVQLKSMKDDVMLLHILNT